MKNLIMLLLTVSFLVPVPFAGAVTPRKDLVLPQPSTIPCKSPLPRTKADCCSLFVLAEEVLMFAPSRPFCRSALPLLLRQRQASGFVDDEACKELEGELPTNCSGPGEVGFVTDSILLYFSSSVMLIRM